MQKSVKLFILVPLVGLFFAGCVDTRPLLPQINETEAFSYEKIYEQEYEEIKNSFPKTVVKWIQPANKKEACKIYVGFFEGYDRTLKDDFKVYWDGECKGGYADGLGREFEETKLTLLEQIGFYKNGMAEDYCIQKNDSGIDIRTIEGECVYGDNKPSYGVETRIKENPKDFSLDISYIYGQLNARYGPTLVTIVSPFMDKIGRIKSYPNYSYSITDSRNDEFDNINLLFEIQVIKDNQWKPNGFKFIIYKNDVLRGVELIDCIYKRDVALPQAYAKHWDEISNEILTAGNKALAAQEQTFIIKKKYIEKICKKSVKVTFMDNDKYRAICNEREEFARINAKIEEQIGKINIQKQQLRAQKIQQQEMQMRQMEVAAQQQQALAAQQQAYAADQANNIQRQRNSMMWFDNFQKNMQMQNLNNNLNNLIFLK
ncbi:MAG: hypothetical protein LBS73_05535 [Campylobacteraceae bacterium]|jgi:hypothetical protein|nr:hypothetical protein [Campylobacteraceae bacterium]